MIDKKITERKFVAKRVFFSFHYQDVIDFRANVVRQHWVTKENRELAGFFDASLWEKSKRTDDDAVKRLVNEGLKNTSVTAVLIGDLTYDRRWVRYEIMKSIEVGNKLIGIHINPIKGRDEKVKVKGPDPFQYLGLKYSADGSVITGREWRNSNWIDYSDISKSLGSSDHKPFHGKIMRLTDFGFPVYDWVEDDGYVNFASWVDA